MIAGASSVVNFLVTGKLSTPKSLDGDAVAVPSLRPSSKSWSMPNRCWRAVSRR